MINLLLFIILLMPALSYSENVTVLIKHDDGGKTSQRHLTNFLNALQVTGCRAIAYSDSDQPAQLLFDPTPRALAFKAHPDYQLIAIARALDGNAYIRGAIVIQASTGITDLNSLKGGWFSFISKNSWAGYLLPIKLLNNVNINENNSHFNFIGNHIGSAAALNHRDVQVAIMAEPLAKRWVDHNNMSIVAVTEAVETGGWWMHKGVSSGVRSQCTKALARLKKSQLKVVPAWIDGFEEVN